MWTLAFEHHEDLTPTHGYAATREQRLPRAGGGNEAFSTKKPRQAGQAGGTMPTNLLMAITTAEAIVRHTPPHST
jgi:hypothetical protein